MNQYSKIAPIEAPISADRQGAKRHYGVHPYFTRRPFNVVQKYILHYSREQDRVLDPFGGSGVTAIEAFLENRVGIQNDINPLANFIAQGIVDLHKGNLEDYKHALAEVKGRCHEVLSSLSSLNDDQFRRLQRSLTLPENIALPSNSDVAFYYDLFSPRQLTALAVLKDAIDAIPHRYAKKGMLLAWSATLTKLNKTFLSAEGRAESRGGSSIFSIYRYKVAKEPIELPPWQTFYERASNIIAAKSEIDRHITVKERTRGFSGAFEIHAKDIEALSDELQNQVDYIFTDPPYGGHISYLDLSTLWNGWLGILPSLKARKKELIVGGELAHTEADYIDRLGKGVAACVKMLKKGRWLSIVFQHWNTAYFEAILSSAADAGAELKGAVSQIGDPIWSMHKKKSNQSVLAGELIISFYKSGKAKRAINHNGAFDVSAAVGRILSNSSADKVYGEYLFNRIVVEAWQHAAIGSLSITKTDFIDLIKQHGWHYDESNYFWVRDKQSNSNGTLF
jgi:16S rRNA G966 N2-methylase RsmD